VDNTFETTRVEAFSDGVFAIAITLLVLEISVPPEEFDDLFRGILDQWPSYLAFATSFWTIAGLWIIHHGIFRRMRYADIRVVGMNLTLLLAVSFLPFPTHLMAEAISSASAERVAVIFYGAVLLAISALMTAIARYAAGSPSLLQEGVTRSEVLAVAAAVEPSLAFYGGLLVAAIFVPQLAAFGLLVLSVLVTAIPASAKARRAAT
jgi:uncharacterized membrane protein